MFCVAEKKKKTLVPIIGHFVITSVPKFMSVIIIKFDFLNVLPIQFHDHVYTN